MYMYLNCVGVCVFTDIYVLTVLLMFCKLGQSLINYS